jgi:pilus assembly protein CpaC
MNKQISMAALSVATASLVAAPAYGQPDALTKNCKSVAIAPTAQVMLGKSSVIPLQAPVIRIVVSGQPRAAAPVIAPPAPTAPTASASQIINGQAQAAAPAAATAASDLSIADMDVLLLSPTDLFLRGKKAGATNLILQDANGVCYLHDIVVSIDPATLQAKLAELMPEESGIVVRSAENAIVLTGTVNDAAKLDEVMRLAAAYGDGKRVVNMLHVTAPQQVMLEVKIAEVSKTLLDKFGIDFSRMFTSADGLTSKAIAGIFGAAPALFGKVTQSGLAARSSTMIGIDAQKKDGLVRVLAQPNIMAISGQSASFLSGGKIFIPVAQAQAAGGSTITLEEKKFGVSLTFTPTVLNGSRVNLKLVSEASELAQTGSPFTTVGGTTSVLPSITTRSIDTTVQLNDGQSFAVAGLIRNNVTESLSRFPVLGDLPILGALFRSTEFQKDQTELIFVITPRLVKPAANFALPTDNHVEPDRADVILSGKAEGRLTTSPATK